MPEKDKSSANPLKNARLQAGLSQTSLAALIGVSKKSVQAWEQGKRKPYPHHRQQLADRLKMTPKELDILFQTSTTDEPLFQEESQEPDSHRQWLMPHPRNEFFTAREELLTQLHTEFVTSENGLVRHALSGLAGVGKSQIAIEYAYRYSETYQTILWVTADTSDSLLTDFVRAASLLRLPQRQEIDKWRVVDAVKQWLNNHTDWLLVLDNVDDPNIIRDFLPQTGRGHLLLTTRDSEAFMTLTVEKMEIADGATLLLTRTGLLKSKEERDDTFEDDREQARAVSEVMDGLPLALDQAGAFIAEAHCSIAEYLQFFRERRERLLRERGRNHSGHPLSFATALLLSFERLEQANPTAANILRLCTFLHPDAIPEELFTTSDVDEPLRFRALIANEFLLAEARRELLRYSLVYHLKDTRAFRVHRLVQAVLQDQMDDQAQQRWAEHAVRLLSQLFSPLEEKFSQRYIAHALVCLDYLDKWQLFDDSTFRLLLFTGSYLRERGLYAQATPICQHALEVAQRFFPTNSAFITMSLTNLVALYTDIGDYEKAEKLSQRAIERSSKNTSLTTGALYEQAYLFKLQGKIPEALALALQMATIVEGHPHWESQLRMNVVVFLADLYCLMKDFKRAEVLLEQAISIYTSDKNTSTLDATHLLNIVLLYLHQQGRDAEAELLCQPTVQMAEALWGLQHPGTVDIYTNVAEIYIHRQNLVKAEHYCKQGIEICLALDLITLLPRLLCYLAVISLSQERYFEAEAYLKQAEEIVKKKFGAKNEQMGAILRGYINLYILMKRDEETEGLIKRLRDLEGLQ